MPREPSTTARQQTTSHSPEVRAVRVLAPLLPRVVVELPLFRRLAGAQAASLLGDQVSMIALPMVAIFSLHAGPVQMGLLSAVGLAPTLIFALHAGVLVDRLACPRQVMVTADIGRAVLLASIPAGAILDVLDLRQLYVVAFSCGVLSVLFSVSYSSVFASSVPAARYTEATAVIEGSRASSQVVGPTLGGVLIAAATAPLAVAIDALSFLMSAFLISSSPARPKDTHERNKRARGTISSVKWIVQEPVIRSTLATLANINFFYFAFGSLFMLYVTRTLHIQAALVGVVLGAGSVGALVSSGVTTRIIARIGIGRSFFVGAICFPAPLILVPLASGPNITIVSCLVAAEFCSGAGLMLLDIAGGSIRASLIPDELRSRIAGAHLLANKGVRPLGALSGGFGGATFGLRPTLILTAIGAAAGFVWLLRSPLLHLHSLEVYTHDVPQPQPGEQDAEHELAA